MKYKGQTNTTQLTYKGYPSDWDVRPSIIIMEENLRREI